MRGWAPSDQEVSQAGFCQVSTSIPERRRLRASRESLQTLRGDFFILGPSVMPSGEYERLHPRLF